MMAYRHRVLEQSELGDLSAHFIEVGTIFNANRQPRTVFGFDRDEKERLVALTKGTPKQRLGPVRLLIRLEAEKLRGRTPETSRYNAGMASVLGGLAIAQLERAAAGQDHSLNAMALQSLSNHVRGLQYFRTAL
jgi:hypothetical protein